MTEPNESLPKEKQTVLGLYVTARASLREVEGQPART